MGGKPWEIIHGDVRKVLKTFPPNSFDAVLSDPPYAYKFMGSKWDYALPSVNVWTELLRVVKPGAHVMLFGGPRTFHRLVCAVEDAGFLPLDLLLYLHGKGFPKSLDISKSIDKKGGVWRGRAGKVSMTNVSMGGPNYERTEKGDPATDDRRRWQGYGTALKPAHEPVLLAMKPLEGTYAENALKWGVGGLAIDGCRVGTEERFNPSRSTSNGGKATTAMGGGWKEENDRPVVGRWPVNLVLDEEAAALLDEHAGEDHPGASGGGKHRDGYAGGMFGAIDSETTAYGDNGGVSRFFYTTKVSRSEREAGCEDLPNGAQGVGALRDGNRSEGKVHNTHPTLKPIDLTRWLARLLLPPPPERDSEAYPRALLGSGLGDDRLLASRLGRGCGNRRRSGVYRVCKG